MKKAIFIMAFLSVTISLKANDMANSNSPNFSHATFCSISLLSNVSAFLQSFDLCGDTTWIGIDPPTNGLNVDTAFGTATENPVGSGAYSGQVVTNGYTYQISYTVANGIITFSSVYRY